MKNVAVEKSSFRDPSGTVYYAETLVFRQINKSYQENFDHFIESGLYKKLKKEGLLLPHIEVDKSNALSSKDVYKVIQTERIPFISYPYEWSFSQFKDAALLMLTVQKTALKFGMSLKDATAYNIQYKDGRPILIDTLSFEIYREGKPWIAYRQFCQHFLSPLALMSYKDVSLSQLLRVYIDGIPLDLTSKLLPKKTWFDPLLLSHIHLHAKSQERFASRAKKVKEAKLKLSKQALVGIIESLESIIKRISWKKTNTQWGDYYSFTNYSKQAFSHKKKIVSQYLGKLRPNQVWDLGANTGEFSRLASEKSTYTVSFDIDPAAVEQNYLQAKEKNETHLLPLILDLTNPSPSLGFAHEERKSLIERGPVDTILALALIHHLAISNNIPFQKIAEFLRKICRNLIIEFVPKADSQVQKLLTMREDIFTHYTQQGFENAFEKYFKIVKKDKIAGSKRVLYLLKIK